MFEQTIRIFSVPSIRRSARWLNIRDLIWLGSKDSQECLRRHRSGTHFHVVRLLQYASPLGPECLKAENKLLKSQRIGLGWVHNVWVRALIVDCNGSSTQSSARPRVVTRNPEVPQDFQNRVRCALKPAFFQHLRRYQLFLKLPLQNLYDKFSQVRALGLRPWLPGKTIDGCTEHMCSQFS